MESRSIAKQEGPPSALTLRDMPTTLWQLSLSYLGMDLRDWFSMRAVCQAWFQACTGLGGGRTPRNLTSTRISSRTVPLAVETHTLVLMSVLMAGPLNMLRTPQPTDPAESLIRVAEQAWFQACRTPRNLTSTRISSRTLPLAVETHTLVLMSVLMAGSLNSCKHKGKDNNKRGSTLSTYLVFF